MIRRSTPRAAVVAALLLGAGWQGAGAAPSPRQAAVGLHAHLYAGLQGGDIYASDDGGVTWRAADAGLPTGADVLVLAAARSGVVYAGTGGAGVYVTRDAGRSWQMADGEDAALAGAQVSGLAVDPTDARMVYAATADGLLYRSVDGGGAWSALALPLGSQITALALDPLRPATLVVGSAADGVLISTDGGASWQAPSSEVPLNASVNALAFSSSSADVAYAATDAGIYQTVDGGATWQYEGRGIPAGISLQSIAVDPMAGAHVLAGGMDGAVYRSTDGGTSWQREAIAYCQQVNALLFNPADPREALAGAPGGMLCVSDDGGADWWHNAPPAFGGASVLSMAGAASTPLPTAPVPPPGPRPGTQYFPQSHHRVRGAFLAFYTRYGGLAIFGLPLTEQFVEGGQTVQYFERARLVLSGARIQISPLGVWFTAGRRFATVPPFRSTPSARYFPATHQALTGAFLSFWLHHHGALLFGPPISQPLYEQNGDGTGRAYLVQYFRNARMEYHPELAGSRYAVTLGLLGQQYLRRRGWL